MNRPFAVDPEPDDLCFGILIFQEFDGLLGLLFLLIFTAGVSGAIVMAGYGDQFRSVFVDGNVDAVEDRIDERLVRLVG